MRYFFTILLSLFCLSVCVSQQIVKGEYFFDNDPGIGAGIPVNFSAGADLSNINFNADLSALNAGMHALYFRTVDNTGTWSHTTAPIIFTITAPAAPQATTIVGAEFFTDIDPGIANATPLNITPGTDIANQIIAAVGPFVDGMRQLYFRTKDNLGIWSHTQLLVLLKTNEPAAASPVSEVEYFIDTDPGHGNGIPVAINAANDIATYNVPINLTGQTATTHLLYWRTRNSNGQWSLTNNLVYSINTAVPAPAIVVNSITKKSACAWEGFRLSFHPTGTYNAGNVFTAQLSDANGSFANPAQIGSLTSTGAGIMNVLLPSHLPDGANYKVRVMSNDNAVTGLNGADAINIRDRPELGADTTSFIVCENETVNLIPLYNTTGLTAAWNINNTATAPAGMYTLIVTNNYGCKDTAVATVKQDVGIWLGTVNSDWHNPANWSNGHVPTEKTHVILAGPKPNPCQITTADGLAASVQSKAGLAMSVGAGRKLEVKATCNPLPPGQ